MARKAVDDDKGADTKAANLRLLKQTRSTVFLLEPWNVSLATDIFRSVLQQSMQYEALSNSTVIEKEFVALRGYDKPVTKYMHMLINHGMRFVYCLDG